MKEELTYAVFLGNDLIASGPLETVLPQLKSWFDEDAGAPFLIFEDQTGRQVDFDLRGTLGEVLARALPAKAPAGPGRPRLGVVSREISLLPWHWSWLEQQPNGASAALRRLVDEARNREQGSSLARDAASRFLSAMAGNLPGYEEALRALYADNRERFEEQIENWPRDVRAHVQNLTQNAFSSAKSKAIEQVV
jgi:uncharacterized protein